MAITFKCMTMTVLLIYLVSMVEVTNAALTSAPPPSPSYRPNPSDAVTFARWLVAQATWGVFRCVSYSCPAWTRGMFACSTISVRLNGVPWGNAQSFADGFPGNGTGTPYFYLSPLDATPTDIIQDACASFTISEETIGTCTGDPEMPDCAKTTLSGNLTQLVNSQPEAIFGKAALIAKHPIFQYLPSDHRFQVFKLILNDIWLVDDFGGAKYIIPSDYYA